MNVGKEKREELERGKDEIESNNDNGNKWD